MTTATAFVIGVTLWTIGLWWLITASARRIAGDNA